MGQTWNANSFSSVYGAQLYINIFNKHNQIFINEPDHVGRSW